MYLTSQSGYEISNSLCRCFQNATVHHLSEGGDPFDLLPMPLDRQPHTSLITDYVFRQGRQRDRRRGACGLRGLCGVLWHLSRRRGQQRRHACRGRQPQPGLHRDGPAATVHIASGRPVNPTKSGVISRSFAAGIARVTSASALNNRRCWFGAIVTPAKMNS